MLFLQLVHTKALLLYASMHVCWASQERCYCTHTLTLVARIGTKLV